MNDQSVRLSSAQTLRVEPVDPHLLGEETAAQIAADLIARI